MPGDIITITVADNLMTKISSGVSEFEIMASPSDDYPELPSVDSTNSMVINQKTLKNMISQTCFAVIPKCSTISGFNILHMCTFALV